MACACSSEKAVVVAAQFKFWERLWVKAGGTNGSPVYMSGTHRKPEGERWPGLAPPVPPPALPRAM